VAAALAACCVQASSAGWGVSDLRTRGIYLALATFALNQVVQGRSSNLDVVGGASGYPVPAISLPVVAAFAVAVVVLMVLLFPYALRHQRDCGERRRHVADLMGLSVRGLRAAFTAGASARRPRGALYAHHFNYIEAQNYGVLFSILHRALRAARRHADVYGPLLERPSSPCCRSSCAQRRWRLRDLCLPDHRHHVAAPAGCS